MNLLKLTGAQVRSGRGSGCTKLGLQAGFAGSRIEAAKGLYQGKLEQKKDFRRQEEKYKCVRGKG